MSSSSHLFAKVLLAVLVAIIAITLANGQKEPGYYTLLYQKHSHEYVVQPGLHKQEPHAVAWGYYEDALNQTGWATLDISSNEKSTDLVQAYGAGYLEGHLTANVIQAYWYVFLHTNYI